MGRKAGVSGLPSCSLDELRSSAQGSAPVRRGPVSLTQASSGRTIASHAMVLKTEAASEFAAAPAPAGSSVVKSAARVLEILELFSDRQEGLTVGQIAGCLGYPQSSTSMLLHSLVRMAYLTFDASERTYFPTVRTAMLGGWLCDDLRPKGSITQTMRELQRATGQTVLLGVQCGIALQYASVLRGASQRGGASANSVRPLYRTALGRVLLSLKTDAEVAPILRRANAEAENPARLDVKSALVEIQQFREEGYAWSLGSMVPGRGAVAICLPVHRVHHAVAIGIAGPLEILREQRANLATLLREVVGRPE